MRMILFAVGQIHTSINSDINSPLTLPPSSLPQPISIDVDGDMKIDLLGTTPVSDSTYQIWKNTWNASATAPTLFKMLQFFILFP